MPRRIRGLKKKGPKAKKVAFELIDPNQKPQHETYRLMAQLRRDYHPDTIEAKIAIAWRKGFKADVDGHLVLGKCVRTSDLQKEFSEWDFIILLNQEVWNSTEFTKEKKLALLDHELCHAAPALDKELEPKVDDRGRKVFRTRGHDVQEFQCIIERHGTYKKDLERFAEAILKRQGVLFPPKEQPAKSAATVN